MHPHATSSLCTHTYTHIHTYTVYYTRSCHASPTLSHTPSSLCTRTYTHTYTHTHAAVMHHLHGPKQHTYTHIHTYIYTQLSCITCTVPHTIKLVFSVFLVPGIIMILSVPPIVLYWQDHKSLKYTEVVSLYWTAVMMLMILTYPMVSRIVLGSFACKNLGQDGYFLR